MPKARRHTRPNSRNDDFVDFSTDPDFSNATRADPVQPSPSPQQSLPPRPSLSPSLRPLMRPAHPLSGMRNLEVILNSSPSLRCGILHINSRVKFHQAYQCSFFVIVALKLKLDNDLSILVFTDSKSLSGGSPDFANAPRTAHSSSFRWSSKSTKTRYIYRSFLFSFQLVSFFYICPYVHVRCTRFRSSLPAPS